jgi:peroxiredoxin/mono/diheme cytochrome c family protein
MALAALIHLTASPSRGEGPAPVPIGSKVEDFDLKDTAGRSWSLGGCRGQKAVVVVFLGTECPINNLYAPKLAELHKEFADKGVQFLAVNSNRQDTPGRVAEHAKQHGIPFPVLKDGGNVVADRFGARRTPEAFLLSPDGTVRYRGRVDDQFGVGFKRPKPTRRDLAEAVTELLAGKPVSRPTTPVAGCLIARASRPRAGGAVTYSKQVARIVQKNCQECHRPGQVGPMPLLTYEDASAWAESIAEVVREGRMPPWHADPRHGKFQNDRRLSREDRDTLLAWVEQGTPRGDARDLPAARTFPEGWAIGKPDAVFSMRSEFKVPAKAPRWGVPYQHFTVSTDFKEDVWVQAAEARPGNRAVVHHIIVFVINPEEGRRRNEDGIGNGFLVGYAPGDMPLVLEPGRAKKIPKGHILVFQMHYTPNGVEQTDRSSVGLVFAKEPPKHEVKTRSIGQQRFAIPPGDDNHKVESASTFRKDALLLSFLPHMHLRGKSFAYRVVYPDGKAETLMAVPRYDFNWQSNYRLEKPLRLPAGSRIECTAYFDNSDKNPNNPDPTKTVRWGDQTWEEMMIGFVDYVYLDEAPGK